MPVSGNNFCEKLSKRQRVLLLEGLGTLIKIIHVFGSRTRNLLA
jgi:hypothetical protein